MFTDKFTDKFTDINRQKQSTVITDNNPLYIGVVGVGKFVGVGVSVVLCSKCSRNVAEM